MINGAACLIQHSNSLLRINQHFHLRLTLALARDSTANIHRAVQTHTLGAVFANADGVRAGMGEALHRWIFETIAA